ncbi:MAG: UvrD-helicase domain-containing protein, partial [Deltaproteobacteria bacterium]|nr:UvrD-helicase domain-containing protein [Deltaproteobacteria bacterium]
MAKNLTPTSEQSEAIRFPGDCGIIAAPGSGKTFVLVEKIAFLVSQKKIPPDRILVVTFSEKAAAEIRERVFARLKISNSSDAPIPAVGTIHATLASFLKHPRILEEPLASLQKLRTTRDLLTRKLKENDPETTAFVDHFGYHRSIRLAASLLSKKIQKNHPYSSVIAAAREAYKKSPESYLDFDDLERAGHELLN